MYTVYYYPTCGTCKKALKWLKDNEIEVTLKHIVEETPTVEVLRNVYEKSGLPINKLFNTSGKRYREMNMKDKIKCITLDEALNLLAQDGMLIKRPILYSQEMACVGFKELEWEKCLL